MNLMKMMNSAGNEGTYDERKVNRTELENGLVVSTCWTEDEGYETAIITKKSSTVCVVERYSNRVLAVEGDIKWVSFAKDGIGKTVTSLDCWDVDEHKEVVLD